MSLQQCVRLLRQPQLRSVTRVNMSVSTCTRGSNVQVSTDERGVATISMNKAPVNSLNMEFIQVLHRIYKLIDLI